jgi:hypothetical protein
MEPTTIKQRGEEMTEKDNPYLIIKNLYTIIGRKTVELEGTQALNKQHMAHIEALKKELKELKEDGDKSNKESS